MSPPHQRVVELLERIEWSNDSAWCPECGVYRWDTADPPPHKSGCELKALMERYRSLNESASAR